MSPEFVKATVKDIPILLQMMEEFNLHEEIRFDPGNTRLLLKQFLEEARLGFIWLIKIESQPIGYVCLTLGYSFEYGGRDAFIDELFIRESTRGLGVGAKTMEFLAQQAETLGIMALHLEVERGNEIAKNLYAKHGFHSNDRILMSKYISDQ